MQLVLGDLLRHRLVPRDDPVALATSWTVAIDDPASRQRDADVGRARVKDHFSLQTMVDAYQALYEGHDTWRR